MHKIHFCPKGCHERDTWTKHVGIGDKQKGTLADQMDTWTDKWGTCTQYKVFTRVATVFLWCDTGAKLRMKVP